MNSAVCRARDLTASVRAALEALLGRPLQEDETVRVQAFSAREAPKGSVRDAAGRALMERIDKTAALAHDIPEAEIDALIDEAADYVRHHREP